MPETPEPSDQLPEEGPAEQVPDDTGGDKDSAARKSGAEAAREQADVRKGERQATGNPDNAG